MKTVSDRQTAGVVALTDFRRAAASRRRPCLACPTGWEWGGTTGLTRGGVGSVAVMEEMGTGSTWGWGRYSAR